LVRIAPFNLSGAVEQRSSRCAAALRMPDKHARAVPQLEAVEEVLAL
jgi:hypothetical protein